MRYSRLFGKSRMGSKVSSTDNAALLLKSGIIHQHAAGLYTYLPMGYRIVQKIENIIRQEMDNVGGQEVRLPSLHTANGWNQTGRWETYDTLFRFKSYYSKLDFVIGPTHEEIVTPLAKDFVQSYKDLPFALYQIQSKFRDEKRPTLGLSRLREFRMKDMYSFHATKDDLYDYYEKVKQAYWHIFQRVGLKNVTHLTLASGGDFTDEYSHEFQTIGQNGQDLIFNCPKCKITYNREVAPSKLQEVNAAEAEKDMQSVCGEGVVGVKDLAKFLKIEVERTTKTLIYETEKGSCIAAAVRGDYNINEEKLMKVTGYKELKLASAAKVKKVTGAIIGYAGIVNLPKEVEIYIDDSMKGSKNFECGANKTNYHNKNVNFKRDVPEPDKFYDFKLAKKGDLCPKCGTQYKVFRALEIGNIFPLETKFSSIFDLNYTDRDGKRQIVYMGCYGIGPDRIVSSVVEHRSDKNGIMWPITIAPYEVHLISLSGDDNIRAKAADLYKAFQDAGIEVLWDDRVDVSAGVKFHDADLLGIPLRVVISKKSLSRDGIEVKLRTETDSSIVEVDKIVDVLRQKIIFLKREFKVS